MSFEMVPFILFDRARAEAETRVFITRGHEVLPDDEYGLLEFYCPDPQCDCRRVTIDVAGRYQQQILAVISYGFDRDDEMAGPFLDPLNRQSPYAETLLTQVKQILSNPAYVARLERHYQQVKAAVRDPAHPVHAALARLDAQDALRPPVRTAQVDQPRPRWSRSGGGWSRSTKKRRKR